MEDNQVKKPNNNPSKTKSVKTAYVHTMNEVYAPPTIGQSMREIFGMIGPNPNYAELAKPREKKRLFKDEKGTFMEQQKKQKGKKTVAE